MSALNTPDESRRSFLKGMAGILAAAAAPAIITTPGLLMPVRKLWTPEPLQIVVKESSSNGSFWIKIVAEDGQGRVWEHRFDPPRPANPGDVIQVGNIPAGHRVIQTWWTFDAS